MMPYPTDRSFARARIASYLAGPHPWAHEVVMEAKEHIFIFLPITAFTLSISLSTLDRDTFLGDVKYRRALVMTALLALFMVLLMFLMVVTLIMILWTLVELIANFLTD
jgi:hypothetical protein